MKHERYHTMGTCPELLDVGREPVAVVWKHGKPTIYTDGLKLKVIVPGSVEFVETVRVTAESKVEYQFTTGAVESEWSDSRAKAFQDCVSKSNTALPLQKSVIFGPSHEAIQQALLAQFPESIEKMAPRKHISWGDDREKIVDEPDEDHRYGGWGLQTFKTIPNRAELMALQPSWADLILDSEDLEESFEMEDSALIERELQTYSLFADLDPLDPSQDEDDRPLRKVLDDERTVFPSEIPEEDEEEMEVVMEENDKNPVKVATEQEETEDNSEDTTDEDDEDEHVLSSDSQSRKRIRVESRFDSEQDRLEKKSAFVKFGEESPVCKPLDEGLHESDFWLLQEEQTF